MLKQHLLEKKSEIALQRVNFSKFSYPGEGHIPTSGAWTLPCAISALLNPLLKNQEIFGAFFCLPVEYSDG